MEIISLDAAVVITKKSRRTWWRRLAQGALTRHANDERGRAMLSWAEIAPHVCIPMTSEDCEFMLRADAGDADAQNDIGQLFSLAGKHEAALYWLQQAAQRKNPDSMQWLGSCYLSGKGVPKDDYLAVMWIAKAASYGHVIAKAQMAVFGTRFSEPKNAVR